MLFLIWIKSLKNNLQVGGIGSPPVLLGYPSAILSNKGDLLNTRTILILQTVLQFFRFFAWNIFITYFVHLFCEVWGIMSSMLLNLNIDCGNKELDINAHHALRRGLLWNTWYKSKPPVFHVFQALSRDFQHVFGKMCA